MTLEKETNRLRGVTAGIGTLIAAFESERPLCAHGLAAPAASGPRREAQRLWQDRPHRRAVACTPASRTAEACTAPDTQPVWLAALLASQCSAVANGEESSIHWNCASGRALYTNRSAATELIRPLGVELPGGGTLAVSWTTGESAYTVEVLTGDAPCRA